jgi:hypothetical protein
MPTPSSFRQYGFLALSFLGLFSAIPHLALATTVTSADGNTYWIQASGTIRHPFPAQDDALRSWSFLTSNPTPLSDADLAQHPLGSPVLMRPGFAPVKVASLDQWFAVGRGGVLRPIMNNTALTQLYPSVPSLPPLTIGIAQYTNYRIGAAIVNAQDFNPIAEANGIETPDQNPVSTSTPFLFDLTEAKSFHGNAYFESVLDAEGNLILAAKIRDANSPATSLSLAIVPDTNIPIRQCTGGEPCLAFIGANQITGHTRLRIKAINELNQVLYSDWLTFP